MANLKGKNNLFFVYSLILRFIFPVLNCLRISLVNKSFDPKITVPIFFMEFYLRKISKVELQAFLLHKMHFYLPYPSLLNFDQ